MSKDRAKSKTTKRSRIKDLWAAEKRMAKRDIGKVRGGAKVDMQIDFTIHSGLQKQRPAETLKSN